MHFFPILGKKIDKLCCYIWFIDSVPMIISSISFYTQVNISSLPNMPILRTQDHVLYPSITSAADPLFYDHFYPQLEPCMVITGCKIELHFNEYLQYLISSNIFIYSVSFYLQDRFTAMWHFLQADVSFPRAFLKDVFQELFLKDVFQYRNAGAYVRKYIGKILCCTFIMARQLYFPCASEITIKPRTFYSYLIKFSQQTQKKFN